MKIGIMIYVVDITGAENEIRTRDPQLGKLSI
jgi:hypothetical protein